MHGISGRYKQDVQDISLKTLQDLEFEGTTLHCYALHRIFGTFGWAGHRRRRCFNFAPSFVHKVHALPPARSNR